MTSYVAKIISKRVLKESTENKFGKQDPYFETYEVTDSRGHAKTKKRKRQIDERIPHEDAQVLAKVKRRAYRLDENINILGIKFGWSSVIGLIPEIGDCIDLFMAMMVVRSAQKVSGGLDSGVQARMYSNITIDFVLGLVPFLGDVADAVFRANTKNAALLEEMLMKRVRAAEKGEKTERGRRGHGSGHVDEPSEIVPGQPYRPDDDFDTRRLEGTGTEPAVPEPARTKSGGWLSRFGGSNRERDVEKGEDPAPAQPPRRQGSKLQKEPRFVQPSDL